MPSKPNILTLAEFLKLKGKQKSPLIVYFNATQWANLTRDITPGKGKPPDKTLTLTLTEIPGLDGGLVTFKCPIECSGPMRGSEGEVHCDCGGSLPTPGGGGGGAPSLEFCFVSMKKDGTVSCKGTCRDSDRKCKPVSWVVPSPSGNRFLLATCS